MAERGDCERQYYDTVSGGETSGLVASALTMIGHSAGGIVGTRGRRCGSPNHRRRWRGRLSVSRDRLQIQQQYPAVGVIRLARGGLRFEDRGDAMQVFLAADRRGFGEVAANEIALCVHLGIDAVIDQPSVLGDLDGDIMGGRADPDGRSILRVVGLPNTRDDDGARPPRAGRVRHRNNPAPGRTGRTAP